MVIVRGYSPFLPPSPGRSLLSKFLDRLRKIYIVPATLEWKKIKLHRREYLERREARIREELRERQKKEELEYQEIVHFWPPCRAIQKNDWKVVEKFVGENPNALTANITEFSETIFHNIACSDENAIWLVKKFASDLKVTEEALKRGDSNGDTALSNAAIFGNTKAAEIFVSRNENLANAMNNSGYLPIHHAAWFGHEETVNYLLPRTELLRESNAGAVRFRLLKFLISSNLFGVALQLLNQYPDLAKEKNNKKIVLEILAKKPLEFASGNRLGFWQKLTYCC